MNGICYWTPNTTDDQPRRFSIKSTESLLHKSNNETYVHDVNGLSVHITENNDEILIGAPGFNNGNGSVIRYSLRQDDIYKDDGEIANSSLWNQANDSYFGYAVASGYFDGPGSTKMLYVASAPRANNQQGEVRI